MNAEGNVKVNAEGKSLKQLNGERKGELTLKGTLNKSQTDVKVQLFQRMQYNFKTFMLIHVCEHLISKYGNKTPISLENSDDP